jgi:hypothetical protein
MYGGFPAKNTVCTPDIPKIYGSGQPYLIRMRALLQVQGLRASAVDVVSLEHQVKVGFRHDTCNRYNTPLHSFCSQSLSQRSTLHASRASAYTLPALCTSAYAYLPHRHT